MSGTHARLVSSVLALVAGALAATAPGLHINVGITIILISGAMFIAEYVRSYTGS